MKLAELVLAGVSVGSMYALVAIGFVVIYKASGILNFAHGSLVVLGAAIVSFTHDAVGFFPAVVLALVGTAALALFVELVIIRRIRSTSVEVLTIATIGIDVLLFTALTGALGADLQSLGHPWAGQVVTVAGIGITVNRLIGLIVAGLIIIAFLLAFRRTGWGLRMRASAEDPETAALLGVHLNRVGSGAWIVAGLLACVAGVFLTGAPTPGLSPALAIVAFVAFPAAIIGGVTSVHGALVGGLIVGLAESLATGYQDQLGFLGRGFGTVVPFLVLLVVLMWRPEGLFGEKDQARV